MSFDNPTWILMKDVVFLAILPSFALLLLAAVFWPSRMVVRSAFELFEANESDRLTVVFPSWPTSLQEGGAITFFPSWPRKLVYRFFAFEPAATWVYFFPAPIDPKHWYTGTPLVRCPCGCGNPKPVRGFVHSDFAAWRIQRAFRRLQTLPQAKLLKG